MSNGLKHKIGWIRALVWDVDKQNMNVMICRGFFVVVYLHNQTKRVSSNEHLREVDEVDAHKTILSAHLQFNFHTFLTAKKRPKTFNFFLYAIVVAWSQQTYVFI